MSKNYAQTYIGIGHRLYAPGDEVECLDDAQWKRLLEAGAIRCEYDPVEAAMEAGEEENAQTSSHLQSGEPVSAEGDEPEEGEEPEDDEPMPTIDVMDGIASDEPQPKKKAVRKKGSV